jgi:HNH endonuclease/AP2 domain
MKEIPLRNRKGVVVAFALVDDADYAQLAQSKWHIDHGYATRKVYAAEGKYNLRMHNAIMIPLPGTQVDHVNHNKLDNQRANLRICTHKQNQYNRRSTLNRSSQFKGVSWSKRTQKWRADITLNGKHQYLGYFDIETDAAKVYDQTAKELFGDFAHLNFPELLAA